MKKIIAFLLFAFLTFTGLKVSAQNELNVSKADTTKLYLRTSTTANLAYGGKGLSIKLDSLQKLILTTATATTGSAKSVYLSTATNTAFGTTTLVSGTKTVTNTKVTANSKIIVYCLTPSGTLGVLYAAPPANITAGTSFVINSYQANATVQTADNSVVAYIIVN